MSTHYKDYYGTHMPFGQFPKFGVLSSVKVLMTGTNIAGPFAASIMAEMGAQVVQVESPNMPCQTRGNYGYSQDHRNTYSITLNTRTAKGKEVLEKLIAWADIWIESGRPGTYAKNGLSDEHMWKINRKLAIVHVSGYGQTGPDKNKAAYDVSPAEGQPVPVRLCHRLQRLHLRAVHHDQRAHHRRGRRMRRVAV